ncbi:MAG: serine/threonine protein kinase [Phycisphaerae bacterium]|nr:serine/threonine protein kinase [Phycisphaerae bacterium]
MSLLEALDSAGEFLSSPTAAVDLSTATINYTRSRTFIGATIGPFKLLELIGEGGFGSVYMAEQSQPIRRRVALKVLKPGMDSRQVIARFEAERQALALMDHPNIARVLDAGSTPPDLGSLPYFAMELVRGVPITQFCDETKLSPRERLELLVPVCLAVQHAHQKGVIHRDIKPTNVLVTLHDGRPVPKVIDFGIAKATGPALTDKTLFTEFRQLIGTPAYMSPEQAEMSGLDIDTRSDVYSLGVLMYELITGSPPFETSQLMEAGLAEMQRIIREQDPPKPSTRVGTSGRRLVTIAGRRSTRPDRLSRIVRGEIDWIVMRAMEKDRTRRYDSAAAFAADVQRYLSGEAVLARPASRAYRARKIVARNKGAAAALLGISIALTAGLAAASAGFFKASMERDRALLAEAEQSRLRHEADEARVNAENAAERALAAQRVESLARESAARETARAESMLAFSDLMIGSANPDVTSTAQTTAREMLDRAVKRADEFFTGQPEAEFSVRVRIGKAYWAHRDRDAAFTQFARADDLAAQLPSLSAMDRYQLYWPYAIVNSFNAIARIRPSLRLGVAIKDVLEPTYPEVASALESMRSTGVIWGQLEESRGHEIAATIEQEIRNRIGLNAPETIPAINALASWGREAAWRRKFANSPDAYSRLAIDCYDRALGMYLEILPETNSDVALVREYRVQALRDLGDYPRALEATNEWGTAATSVLPPEHWMLHLIRAYTGVIELRLENPTKAAALLEHSIRGVAQAPGYDAIANQFAEYAAEAYRQIGASEEAARWEIQAAEWCKTVGAAPVTRAVLARGLSSSQAPLLDIMTRYEDSLRAKSTDAGPAMLEFISLHKRLCPPSDPAAYMVWWWAHDRSVAFESGAILPGMTPLIMLRLKEHVLDVARQLPRLSPYLYGFLPYRVAYHLCEHDDPDVSTAVGLKRAEALLREGIGTLERYDPDHHYVPLERSWLGECLSQQGRYEEALSEMGDCLTPITRASGAGSYYAAEALRRRVRCLLALHRHSDARALIRTHLALHDAEGMSPLYATYYSTALLRGGGQSEEDVYLAVACARQAAAWVPKIASAQAQLVRALARAGLNDESHQLGLGLLNGDHPGTPSPNALNNNVWNLVKEPGVPLPLVEKAAEAMKAVVASAPENAAFAKTLAAALYRAERFEAALARAQTRVKSFRKDGFTEDPSISDYLILAMSLHKLGRSAEAKAALDTVPDRQGPFDDEVHAMMMEADRTLGQVVPNAPRGSDTSAQKVH